LVNSLNKLRERATEREFWLSPGRQKAIQEHMIECWEAIATMSKGMDIPYILVLQPYMHLRKTQTREERNSAEHYEYRRKFLSEMFIDSWKRVSIYDFPGDTYVVNATEAFDETPADKTIFRDEAHITNEGNVILTDFVARRIRGMGYQIPVLGELSGADSP
jgi:hypothetical protein